MASFYEPRACSLIPEGSAAMSVVRSGRGRPFHSSFLPGLRNFRGARAEVLAAWRQGNLCARDEGVADGVPPEALPSFAHAGAADRVVAELDQDGFAFAADPADESFFNRRKGTFPRVRYRLQIVMRRGRVCLRKEYRRQTLLRKGLRPWFW